MVLREPLEKSGSYQNNHAHLDELIGEVEKLGPRDDPNPIFRKYWEGIFGKNKHSDYQSDQLDFSAHYSSWQYDTFGMKGVEPSIVAKSSIVVLGLAGFTFGYTQGMDQVPLSILIDDQTMNYFNQLKQVNLLAARAQSAVMGGFTGLFLGSGLGVAAYLDQAISSCIPPKHKQPNQ